MLLKRLLIGVLVALSAVSLVVGVDEADRAERTQLQNAGMIGIRFTVPVQPSLSDPDVVLEVLEQVASANRANVLRTSRGYDAADQPLTTHYLYLGGDRTDLLSPFRLREGRLLAAADTRAGVAFLATRDTGQAAQVGLLDDINHNDVEYVRPLSAALASLPVAGEYGVECAQPEDCSRFLGQLAEEFSRLGAHLEPGQLEQPTTMVRGEMSAAATPWTWSLIFAVVVAVAILAAFRQLHESKRTAVLSLHGYGALQGWFQISGRITLVSMLTAGAGAVSAAALVPGGTTTLVATVAATVMGSAFLAVLATLASTAYIRAVSVPQGLKNRKDTGLLVWLSLVLRFGIATALIVMGAAAAAQYDTMSAARTRLGSWQATSQYGVFVPKGVGLDLDELQTGGLASTSAEVHDLYPQLDSQGAVFIDAGQYETEALSHGPVDGFSWITVNPNYLSVYPIIGEDGRPILVDDSTTDWILLVPASLHDRATAITHYFQRSRTGDEATESVASLEKRLFGRDVSAAVRNQRVKIVWTSDHQQVFAFNPDVAPEQGNRLTDPIVAVMTTANSAGVDRMNGVSGSPGAAIKVKLVDGDAATTLTQLQDILRPLQLDDNLTHLVTLNDYALAELQWAQDGLAEAVAKLALALALFVLIAVQSATLLFEQNARRVVVRRLHGLSFARRHDQVLTILAGSWMAQTAAAAGLLSFADGRWGLPKPGPSLILVAAAFAAIELVISAGTLSLTERRRVPAILKGEF